MTEKPLLIEPHYFPSLSWIALVSGQNEVLLDVSSNFVKGSFRNRMYIPGANGLQRLSVPLEHGRGQKLSLSEVKISYASDWQKLHWYTIESCYRRSPYFEYLGDIFHPLFARKYTWIRDLYADMFAALGKCISFPQKIRYTSAYIEPGSSDLNDMRDVISPGKQNPLQLPWRHYRQVFSERYPFYADMSILDAIFNLGKITQSDIIV